MVAAGLLIFAVLAAQPVAWARPGQAPAFQTVPTLTPTPTRPGQEPEPTRRPPTDTPPPPPTAAPGQPTATLMPPTATPTAPASTPLPVSPTASSGALPISCWTVPTPGFSPERLDNLAFAAESGESLVVPGQTLTLRLTVANRGNSVARGVLICNPLPAALQRGQPNASQGRVRLEPQGLIAELGDLPAGQTAQVSLTLVIPPDYPLGGVIEDQAWLFSEGQRASTQLLTWALPPAWLPPTGQ